ncbi:hypothetical protein [Dyadobacter diqingensis]|uniref:hypothetical protein n=1 Tax=Dyadobacter diqingensis TaxID=2938121 RepID=UPI0020C18ACF|nr:hypothetical protein [Dyadobacter diqingensis]
MKSQKLDLNPTRVLILIFLILVGWHLIIFFKSDVALSAPFMATPKPGFLWQDSKTEDSRFLARDLDVAWEPGLAHPKYKLQSSDKVGVWIPMPGYQFVDQTKGLETLWTPGLLHPDFKAWSDTGEGLWIPATGYKFVYEGDTFVATEWDPGIRYDELKIISLEEPDSFTPFPGYQFVSPGKTFDVVWTPGLVNSDNPRLVSGSREGSWEVNVRRTYQREPTWVEKEIVRGLIYHAL